MISLLVAVIAPAFCLRPNYDRNLRWVLIDGCIFFNRPYVVHSP